MQKKHVIAVLFIVLVFVNCKKDEDNQPTDTQAAFLINAPVANTHYPNTTPLYVRGIMHDPDILKNARVEIKNKNTGTVYFTQTISTGSVPQYNFDFNWTVSGMTGLVTATVRITAIDQFDRETSRAIDVFLED